MEETERLDVFLASLEKPESPVTGEIRRIAEKEHVPILREETAALLRFFIHMKKPAAILEVGTAIGYSALLMAEEAPEAKITTIEKVEKKIAAAKENFAEAGKEDQITLLEGDADDILKTLKEPFDLILMDAAKGQYLSWLPDLLRLSKQGTVIFSDNVLKEGEILQSRYAIPRRDRTIHKRMRAYLLALKQTKGLTSVVLPEGDGVTVTVVDDPDLALIHLQDAQDDGRAESPAPDRKKES